MTITETTTTRLLELRGLSVAYLTERGRVPACSDINLTINRGEIIGVAGESASGKSTLLTAITRLQRIPAVTVGGQVLYHGSRAATPVDLVELEEPELAGLRWSEISVVMQSAMACLNPVLRLRAQFADVLKVKNPRLGKAELRQRIAALLAMVGIAPDYMNHYPHQLSGGMQQRSLIALAMACDPELVVMDEPTTAVDVVMQRRILNQVLRLQRRLGFAVIFVTHDLSLLLEIADRIAIMYGGRIVEVGTAERVYRRPRHPYTRGLRDSFPPLTEPVRRLTGIAGTPPNLLQLPAGCAFQPRCRLRIDRCADVRPELTELGDGSVACHVAVDDPEERS
ncbi:ABC transporter ATP-binding protein [Microlunatus parietis]|uniref:Peptide/nickel transport system ATP-binding protein n=1 Tax=Microlunatus parietis TaxID=682979 RepID=A0A7Y9IDG9_9ACTN|nr:ABC transporter ATP-binding protein [Microlunatus parietis]NYE74692.1 peptide/nickel transport system ATP-binding protein [Microlunatus parietis]